jgi:5'-nucleotidase
MQAIFFRELHFNYYGGELEFKLMSMMQYDASTIGNHDFDNGVKAYTHNYRMLNLSFYLPTTILKNTWMDR